MKSLENYIRDKEVEFYFFNKKIDTNIKDFGEYNWNLVEHIIKKGGKWIAIKGFGLDEYLKEPKNLYTLADFAGQLWYKSHSMPIGEVSVHINVDIDSFSKHYVQPKKEPLINGLGQTVCDASTWAPDMSYFEKTWNFALCNAVGGMVGYPGYEHPKDDASFRYEAADHALKFMIGTKKQLERYKKYALQYLQNVISVTDKLSKDPDSIYENAWPLHGIESNANCTRKIAENISYFTADFDKKV